MVLFYLVVLLGGFLSTLNESAIEWFCEYVG